MGRLSETISKTNIYLGFVKRAGIKETLDQLGVSDEVSNWVLQQPQPVLAVVMPALKANPNASIQDLSSLQPVIKPTGNVPYTEEEYLKAQALAPQVGKWYLIQCRKSRNTPIYQELQDNIDQINKYINLFGNNLGNYSVIEALKHLEQVGPVWNLIKYTDQDFRAWVTRQLIESPKASKLRDNLISVRDWYAATAGGTPLPGGGYSAGTDIKTYNVDLAIEKALEWHRELPKDDDVVVYTTTKPENIVYAPKEWDGWNIQRVTEPQDLKVEGNLMHHCVGSYVDDVKEGRSLIYSLRDPYNVPKVTIELNPNLEVVQTQAYGDSVPPEKYQKMVDEWVGWVGNNLYEDDTEPLLPEIEAARGNVLSDSVARRYLEEASGQPIDESIKTIEKVFEKCNPVLVREWALKTATAFQEEYREYQEQSKLLLDLPRLPDDYWARSARSIRLEGLRREAEAKKKALESVFGRFRTADKLDSITSKGLYLSGIRNQYIIDQITGEDTLVLVNSTNPAERRRAAIFPEIAPELINDEEYSVAYTAADTIISHLPEDQVQTQYTSSNNGFIVLAAYKRITAELIDKIENISYDNTKDEDIKQKEKDAIIIKIQNLIYNERNTSHIENVFRNMEERHPDSISRDIEYAKERIGEIFARFCDINQLSEDELLYYATKFGSALIPRLDKDKLQFLWDAGLRSFVFLWHFIFPYHGKDAQKLAPYITEEIVLEALTIHRPNDIKSSDWNRSNFFSRLLSTEIGKKVALENNLITELERLNPSIYEWLQDYPLEILPLLKTNSGIYNLCKDKKLTTKQLQLIYNRRRKGNIGKDLESIIASQMPENLWHTIQLKTPEARKILYDRATDPKSIKRLMSQDIPALIEYGNRRLRKLKMEINKQKKKKRKSAGIDEIGKFSSIFFRFANQNH